MSVKEYTRVKKNGQTILRQDNFIKWEHLLELISIKNQKGKLEIEHILEDDHNAYTYALFILRDAIKIGEVYPFLNYANSQNNN